MVKTDRLDFSFFMNSQMEMKCVLGMSVSKGTVLGQSGGSGVPALGHVGWDSSRGFVPLSTLGPTVHGATTSWKETWSIASVTSSLVKVSKKHVQHL